MQHLGLPGWPWPQGRPCYLGCHADPRRRRREGDCVRLHSAGRGQEFVLDCADDPEAVGWLRGLLKIAAHPKDTQGSADR